MDDRDLRDHVLATPDATAGIVDDPSRRNGVRMNTTGCENVLAGVLGTGIHDVGVNMATHAVVHQVEEENATTIIVAAHTNIIPGLSKIAIGSLQFFQIILCPISRPPGTVQAVHYYQAENIIISKKSEIP